MTDPSLPTVTGIHAQQQLAPGTVLAGRFRIEAMLGIGGMGVVYRATDTALGVPVALKLLRPELATRADAFERFRQELLMARQVSSPRVVRIHDLAQHDGQWMISMDFVDGEGLDHIIDRDGPMAFDVAARIARQLAEGLAAAHARGVIHRDLKPANVLVDRNGDAFISDFGVARSLASNGLTQTGAVVGTPDYLSPEQARGESVDARSDLYALGLILYEMLTGQMPFPGATVSEAIAQRMVRSPPSVTRHRPDTPTWLARLVDRLLRTQPAHRLQSAEEVIRAIDRREVPREFRMGRGAWIAVAAALALALGTVVLWQWRERAVPAGVAAVAPLHRLLVLPLEAPAGALPQERLVALAAQLRNGLASMPGLAVVDEDRTQQALRQLDPTGTARVDTATLERIVGADRILRMTLAPDGKRWRATAALQSRTGGTTTASAGGDDPAAAMAAVLADAGIAKASGAVAGRPVLVAPSDPRALDPYGAGLMAWQRGAPEDALASLRAATDAVPDFAAAWLAHAEVAQAIGELDAAYEAIERGEGAGAKASEVVRQRLKAERATLDGDAPAAAALWRARLESTPDDTFAELNLARALGSGGDFKAATERLQKLTARDPNDPRAWFELGKFSILQGEARRAVDDYLVRALVLYKRSGNRYGEGETVNALGIGYIRLGQHTDAEEQYRKAVELRRAVGNRRGLATSLRNLGSALSLSGNFDEASKHLRQARELHAALGDRGGLAAVEQELGIIAEERGDYPAALASFRRALQTWQQIGDPRGTAQALNDIGFAHYQLGNYNDAQAYLVQSANASSQLGDETGRIRAQQNLGLVAMARGQWSEARRQFDQSFTSAEQQQMLEEAAVSRRNLAELALMQGHLNEAIEQCEKAKALFVQRDDDRGLVDIGLLHTQALLAAHADGEARAALDALKAPLARASSEQRGIAALLRAQLADRAGDHAAEARALNDAQRQAQASGVRVLLLQVALQAAAHAPPAASLDRSTAELGHLPLRLQWLRLAMRNALAAGDAASAAKLYREALPALRRGDYLEANALHELGAKALAATGDAGGSAIAQRSAQNALQTVREHVPIDLLGKFDAAHAPIAPDRPAGGEH